MRAAHLLKKYILAGWISLVLLLGIGSPPSSTHSALYLATTEDTHRPAPLKHHHYLAFSFSETIKFTLPEVPFQIRLGVYAQHVVQVLKNTEYHTVIKFIHFGHTHQKTSLFSEDPAPVSA